VYDIRLKCEFPPLCYDLSYVDNFVARDDVRKALGVGNRKWVECNQLVHTAMLGDWLLDLSDNIINLIKNKVKILVYSGDRDFICNWRGGEKWVDELDWEHQSEFKN